MLHTVLIGIHAAAGVVGFAAGCGAVVRPWVRSIFAVYLVSLVVLAVALAAVLGMDWPTLAPVLHAVFAVLTVLAGYLIWQAATAYRLRGAASVGARSRYLDHVGFTLVALFDGFAIITVVVDGGPGWLAAAVGVAGVVAGHFTIRRLKHRLASGPVGASGQPHHGEPT
jgi:hypothetical protein